MTVHHARGIALAAVLVGISALVLSSSVRAQRPFSELPLNELRALAEQGNEDAQGALAFLYANGEGVPQNADEATRWFSLWADGDPGLLFGVGFLYENSQGVPQSDTEAVRWYRMAADQGHASAS